VLTGVVFVDLEFLEVLALFTIDLMGVTLKRVIAPITAPARTVVMVFDLFMINYSLKVLFV